MDSKTTLYVREIDDQECTKLNDVTFIVSHKDKKGELGPNWDTYQKTFTANTSIHGKRIVRILKKLEREQQKYRNQLIAITKDEKTYHKVFRCIRYGDKVPRKHMRKYGMVIKNLQKQFKAK